VTRWVGRLLVANVVVFLLQMVLPAIEVLGAFVPARVLAMPWTPFTYMFLHSTYGLTHILFNMLALYLFGPRVESHIGSGRFLNLYVIAGLLGAAAQGLFEPTGSMIGASAAVGGVVTAYAVLWPRQVLLIWGVIPAPAWILAVFYALWDLSSGLGGSRDGVAHWAHLGGYAGGLLYLKLAERFSDARRFRAKVAAVKPDTERTLKQNWRNVDLKGVHELSRDEVNRILDKINAEGIGSLTTQEKLFLSNFVPPDDRKNWVQ